MQDFALYIYIFPRSGDVSRTHPVLPPPSAGALPLLLGWLRPCSDGHRCLGIGRSSVLCFAVLYSLPVAPAAARPV